MKYLRKLCLEIMDSRPTKAYWYEGEVLFYRAYLCRLGPWVLYLHRYMRPDPERGLHDHPMKAWIWIICGGYLEHRLKGFSQRGMEIFCYYRRPGSLYHVTENHFHRIGSLLNGDSWSFFLARYVLGKAWGLLSFDASTVGDGDKRFIYTHVSGGLEDTHWWDDAPNGCIVRELAEWESNSSSHIRQSRKRQ